MVDVYTFYDLESIFHSGKYIDKSVEWCIINVPEYIIWRLKNPFSKEEKSYIDYPPEDKYDIDVPWVREEYTFLKKFHFVLSKPAYDFLYSSVKNLQNLRNLNSGKKIIFQYLKDIRNNPKQEFELTNSQTYKLVSENAPESIYMLPTFLKIGGDYNVNLMISDMNYLKENQINDKNLDAYWKEKEIKTKQKLKKTEDYTYIQKAINEHLQDRLNMSYQKDSYDEDYFYAMTDGQIGNFDDFIANGGNIDSIGQ